MPVRSYGIMFAIRSHDFQRLLLALRRIQIRWTPIQKIRCQHTSSWLTYFFFNQFQPVSSREEPE
jgi:hypothetical protein